VTVTNLTNSQPLSPAAVVLHVDGGEGFNATRTDTGYVAMYTGVVSSDDGLTHSVLTVQHKFDNPAVRIMVLRIE
jgi:hypothetical protein